MADSYRVSLKGLAGFPKIILLILSGVISYLLCIKILTVVQWYTSPYFLIGTVGGLLGGIIGKILKFITLPTSCYTREGLFHILFIKFFWSIGIEIIALICGSILFLEFVPLYLNMEPTHILEKILIILNGSSSAIQ